MKKFTERALKNYIRTHSDWGPKKREERLRFFALALCGEAGELANLIKKEWRGDFKHLKGDVKVQAMKRWLKAVVSEAADVGAYNMMFLDLLTGGNLPKEVWKKFMEVEQRPSYQRGSAKRRKGVERRK